MFVFFFGRIIGLKEPVWLCLTFNVIFIHRKYTRSTHNNPLTRKTSSSCMVYAPLETQYITDKYFWKDVPCDVKAPFICKHNSDLLGFHKLRLSLFDYLVASNHTEKKSILTIFHPTLCISKANSIISGTRKLWKFFPIQQKFDTTAAFLDNSNLSIFVKFSNGSDSVFSEKIGRKHWQKHSQNRPVLIIFTIKKAAVVLNFCLIGNICRNFLEPRMIESTSKTFMPIQILVLHRVILFDSMALKMN